MSSADYRKAMQGQVEIGAVDSPPSPRRAKRDDPEARFQAAVIEMATALGWTLVHHETDSRKSRKGWLDLTLYRHGTPMPRHVSETWRLHRMIFVELKTGRRKVTEAQQAWIDAHNACGHEVYVWRESPETWAEIERVLR
jgi:hypothetical protein